MEASVKARIVFVGVGGILLIIGIITGVNTFRFLQNAQNTNGVVVGLKTRDSKTQNTSNSKTRNTFDPIVKFKTNDSVEITFTDRTNTSIYVGKRVNVLYSKNTPSEAKIDNGNIYLGSIIASSLGVVGLMVGVVFIGLTSEKPTKEQRAFLKGAVTIKAEYKLIEEHKVGEKKESSTFFIICEWWDPKTNTLHKFKSKDIPYNPEQVIKPGQEFKVSFDPNNINNYQMDISALPDFIWPEDLFKNTKNK